MSKAEIMAALPGLGLVERREILERIYEIDEKDLLKGGEPNADEKRLLDRELEEYNTNPEAGSTWKEVEARLRR